MGLRKSEVRLTGLCLFLRFLSTFAEMGWGSGFGMERRKGGEGF